MQQTTLLYRQIHPAHIQEHTVSTQAFNVSSSAFKPTPNDEGKLSVYNGERFGAEESHIHYTTVQQRVSAGVLAVSVSECAKESLPCHEDNIPFEGHCHIDFNGNTSGQIKKKAAMLRDAALKRGWMFHPAL